MKSFILLATTLLVSAAHAQFEKGFVKILEDQRYQEGATFGNFRNQEDGIKYKEETNAQGVRTGFWEYPDENGKVQRVEFEAGPQIGFRIVSSSLVQPTPIAQKTTVRQQQPLPVQRARPQPQPQRPVQPRLPQTLPVKPRLPQPLPVQPRLPQLPVIQQQPKPTQPEPINLFDYPADLQFFRDAGGHRFKFTAV